MNANSNCNKVRLALKRIEYFDCCFSRLLVTHPVPAAWFKCLRIFVRIGDGWFWAAVVFLIFLSKPQNEFSILCQCLLALAISLSLYWPLKLGIRRSRPFDWMPGISAGVPPLDKFSFPSGHTMHNLAVGLTVAHYFPPAFWPLAIIPFIWGLFRIYFGVHFLSDVVVGGFLGICSFRISEWVFV